MNEPRIVPEPAVGPIVIAYPPKRESGAETILIEESSGAGRIAFETGGSARIEPAGPVKSETSTPRPEEALTFPEKRELRFAAKGKAALPGPTGVGGSVGIRIETCYFGSLSFGRSV